MKLSAEISTYIGIYQKIWEIYKETGNPALSAEIAFGSLYIQRKLSLTDRELVEQISENPYMQYFIGYKEYITEKPFDPSLLVTFRKRLTAEMMEEISEKMFPEEEAEEDEDGDDDDRMPPGSGSVLPEPEVQTDNGHLSEVVYIQSRNENRKMGLLFMEV